jgi:hypothetical protein
MFDFLRLWRSPRPELSAALQKALVDERMTTGIDPLKLRVVQRRGSYSGRSVSYFRVFDPASVSAAGMQPRKFEDLDGHADLILGTGHVESGGAVVLTRRASTPTRPTASRSLADRGSHGDDERVVLPDGASAR